MSKCCELRIIVKCYFIHNKKKIYPIPAIFFLSFSKWIIVLSVQKKNKNSEIKLCFLGTTSIAMIITM